VTEATPAYSAFSVIDFVLMFIFFIFNFLTSTFYKSIHI